MPALTDPSRPRADPARNFFERFEQTVARHGQRIAVEIQRPGTVDRVTYAELKVLARRYAARLVALDVEPGDRCAILAANGVDWCAAYLGILATGAVVVPLDTAYSAVEIRRVLDDSGARVIFVTEAHGPLVEEAMAMTRRPVALLPLPMDRAAGLGGREARPGIDERLTTGTGATADPVEARRDAWSIDEPAVILYTSGTTSDPKGVVLTHGNIQAEAEAVFEAVEASQDDAILGVLPLFHALAQMANLLLPFWVGGRVVFLEQVNASELLRALRERDVTALCIVPQFFYLIHERILRDVAAMSAPRRVAFRTFKAGNDWLRRHAGIDAGPLVFARVRRLFGPRMRLLVTGGARFDPGIARDFHALGIDVLQAYGLTECAGAATLMRPGQWAADTVGRPLPDVDLRIAPAPGAATVAGEGEILVRGPIVMRGYHGRADATAAALRDGWLHTGDLGSLGRDGTLRVTGRLKDVIVLGSGKNVYPEELEAHYERSPLVREICVVAVQREGEPAAERLHAVVVPDLDVMRERRIVNTREWLRFEIENLSVSLPAHKRILGFDIWTERLPRTTTQKLRRHEIARRVSQSPREHTRPADAARPVPDSGDPRSLAVLDVVRRRAPAASLSRSTNLELDLGLDSMERVELLTEVQSSLGVSIDEADAQRIYTLGDLLDLIRGAAGRSAIVGGADPWSRVLAAPPIDHELTREIARPKRLVTLATFVLLKAIFGVAWLVLGFRVSGRNHLPDSGPFLICPNHESYLDGLLLCSALPYRTLRSIFLVGASEYFATRPAAWLARLWNIVPVDADANLVSAMRVGAAGLRQGKVLVLFPEGERSIDGEVKTFRKGGPILASRLRVPIVPASFAGLFEVWPRSRPVRWTAFVPRPGARTRLAFGPPLAPGSLPDETGREEEAAERLRQAVVALKRAHPAP